jgi:hypothetical protein
VRPILDAREMGGSQADAAALVRGDSELACRYAKTFGVPPPAGDEAVLAGIGKALAAFQETIVSGRTPFDEFRDALEQGDRAAVALPAVGAAWAAHIRRQGELQRLPLRAAVLEWRIPRYRRAVLHRRRCRPGPPWRH